MTHNIRYQNILHRPVFDLLSNETLGQVTHLWLDFETHQVLGLTARLNFWNQQSQIIPWRHIVSIESDQIRVNSFPHAQIKPMLNFDMETYSSVSMTVNYEVWTYSGILLGSVTDYRFDINTGSVTDYCCVYHRGKKANNDHFYLLPSMIADVGRGWLLVPDNIKRQQEVQRSQRSQLTRCALATA